VSAGQGKHQAARTYYQEGLTIARTMRNKMRISWMLTGLGDSARLAGDFGSARTFLEENLVIARERGAPKVLGVALVHLGTLAQAEGDLERAKTLIKESIGAFRDGNGRAELAVAISYCGMLAVAQGAHRRGARLLGAGDDPEIARRTLPGWWQGPDDRQAYKESLAAARASLGDDEYGHARIEGQAMTLDQAVAYALEGDRD
jgi:tetratricopeptide (TPR) repeat protein